MTQVPATLSQALERFSAVLERDFKRLESMTFAQVETPREAGNWTPKQIIGHLTDSAANNHQRFVRGQLEPQPTYDFYDQNAWMDLQNYAARDWSELLTFWHAYNRHLLHLMKTVKPETLEHVFQMPTGVPNAKTDGVSAVTLEFLMRDYVRHLEHHLVQIFPTSER